MNRLFFVIAFVAAIFGGQSVWGQATVSSTADTAKSAIRTNFVNECTKNLEKLKMFPSDTSDPAEACNCTFKKVEGNARMTEFLSKLGAINMKMDSPTGEYRYQIAKLFSALVACKSAQLDQLADSGALDASGDGAVGADAESRSQIKATSRPTSLFTAPSYNHDSAECRPTMPAVATATQATGLTKLKFLVEKTGRVSKFWIVKSSGDTLAHKVMDVHAAAAMSVCPFSPALRDGKPVDQVVDQEFHWTIE